MLRPAIERTRTAILSRINRGRLRRGFAGFAADTIPIVFIFTPEIAHLAPYCVPAVGPRFKPVLVMNAVHPQDVDWIRSIHPDLPLVELRHSLSRNSQSLLPHGDVLNDLFAVATGNFIIQDPDCFVTDPAFWDAVKIEQRDFACGAFWEQAQDPDHVLPHTFFLMFNVDAFRTVASKFQIDAGVIRALPPRAAGKALEMGYEPGKYPHKFKDYFDTLQAFWVLSLAEGWKFREIPGQQECVFHIGGTSYLHKTDIDLSHWDYWPLSVLYFNLRLLELHHGQRFRTRYGKLIEAYGSADGLLTTNPEFSSGWRRARNRRNTEECWRPLNKITATHATRQGISSIWTDCVVWPFRW